MSDQVQFKGWAERATRVLIGPSGLPAGCWQFAQVEGVPVEYPGQGGRERRAGWTYRTMAQEIADSHEGPLDVLGVSTGGAVVVDLLLHHAGRIRSAIIVGSEAVASPDETAQRAGAALEKGMQAIVDATLPQWFSPYALRADLPGLRYVREALLKTDPAAWHDSATAQARSEAVSLAALKSVVRPVTIAGCMHDRAGGLRRALHLHEAIPNSRFEIWPASAMMHLEQPEFIQAILDRHSVWAPNGNRVEAPLHTCVWLGLADGPFGNHMGSQIGSSVGRPA